MEIIKAKKLEMSQRFLDNGRMLPVTVLEILEGNIEVLKVGGKVKVTAISKGKGFQGVVRRHKFKGGPATHGHKDNLRMPGSVSSGGLQHIPKGKRMAGRMGGTQNSVRNLEIVEVNVEKKNVALKGSVPGAQKGKVTMYV